MESKSLDRGAAVTVRAYRGALLHRRVWEDTGRGVMLCSETGFQRAVESGEPPLCSGFPKEDVVSVGRGEDG